MTPRPFAIPRRSPRLAIRAFLLFACTILLAGCGHHSQRAGLVFINGAEPETLDPALVTGQPEGRIVSALFEGLMAFDRSAQPQPGVAERWEVSPDGRTYTFHLRPNARWSNGDPVTSRDFVDSWHRTLAPETASEYAYQLHYLKNGKAFNEGTLKDFSQVGVRAPDSLTLIAELENPTPFFIDLCAFGTLMPVHMPTLAKFGDEWTKPGNIVGNGAYSLTEWRINDRIRLTKNPFYWNKDHIAIETVDVLPISKANTALNFFLAGQAGLIMDKGLTPTSLLGELKTKPYFHSAPFLGTYFLRFNVTKKPFDDPRVRLAFNMAIDKRRIVEKITRGGELPAGSLVPPGTGHGYVSPPGLEYDPDGARKLLAAAGFPSGAGFPLVTYLYCEGDMNEALAVELQNMFSTELGVHLTLERQEWKVYLRSMSNLDFDVCRASWVGDYNDPNTFLDMFLTDGGNNRTGWSSSTYDGWIADAARELDPQKRFAIFQKAEHLLIDEQAPIAPLFFYVGIQFYHPEKLGGIQANLLDEHPIKSMYLIGQ